MNSIIDALRQNNITYSLDIDLSNLSYLKTGGKVSLLISPKTTSEVVFCVKLLNIEHTIYKVIGATSNLMFLDRNDYTCFLSTMEIKGIEFSFNQSEIMVGSGILLPDLSRIALYHSVTGFEGFEGIPGTVGGAVFMNAGAYGYEIKKILKLIEIVDSDGNVKLYQQKDLNLKNRNSALRTGTIKGIITRCWFIAIKDDIRKIEHRMELFHSKRHKYLEYLYPNLGSIFSGSIYRELGKGDKYFFVLSTLFYLFNYKWKIFRRESPINRTWINDIVVKRFGLKYELQPFSDKTLNCIVNRGQGTDEMIRYIEEMTKLTKGKIPVENEIVLSF